MIKKYIIIIVCLIILASCVSQEIQYKPNKVDQLLPISVKGNNLIRDGKPFRLIGVSIADPYHLATKDYRFKEDMFKQLSTWDINAVRVPIHPGGWLADKNYMEKYLDVVIGWAAKYNLYIILDWHAIGNPLNGVTQALPQWKIKDFKPYDSSPELWESAWQMLSEKYGKNPQIIFELFNEPVALGEYEVTAKHWTQVLHSLIDKIRINAPDTLILVSGWKWTYDLSGFKDNPVKRENIGYVAHIYASHDKGWDTSFGWVAEKYPLVITEWGFSPDVDESMHYYGARDGFGQRFYKYMKEIGASWLAWCYHPTWLPNLIKNWDFELSNQGWFIDQILTRENNLPLLSALSPENNSVIGGTVILNGVAEDDTGLLTLELKIDNNEYKEVKNDFNDDFRTSNWSYNLNTYKLNNGTHTISIRAIDTSDNQSILKLNLNVKNERDEDAPVITLESEIEGQTLTGTNTIKALIKDESGIEQIRACIDGKENSCYDSEKISLSSLYNGVFTVESPEKSFSDNYFTVDFDTTKVDNGAHILNITAEDLFGNIGLSKDIIFYTNNDRYLIGNCDNIMNWDIYSGGGSIIEKQADAGVAGGCVKVNYDGSPVGWWGCRKISSRDYSKYNGVEFYMKGTPNQIRLQIVDNEYKCWVYFLVPKEEWEQIRIPFKDLKYRGDWQKEGIPQNRDQKLNPILDISIIHTVENQDADGSFWIDEWRLF